MVLRSAKVITVYNGQSGGTGNTIRYTRRRKVPVVLLRGKIILYANKHVPILRRLFAFFNSLYCFRCVLYKSVLQFFTVMLENAGSFDCWKAKHVSHVF